MLSILSYKVSFLVGWSFFHMGLYYWKRMQRALRPIAWHVFHYRLRFNNFFEGTFHFSTMFRQNIFSSYTVPQFEFFPFTLSWPLIFSFWTVNCTWICIVACHRALHSTAMTTVREAGDTVSYKVLKDLESFEVPASPCGRISHPIENLWQNVLEDDPWQVLQKSLTRKPWGRSDGRVPGW